MRTIHPKGLSPRDAALQFYQQMMEIGRRSSLRDPIAAVCEKLELTPPQLHSLGWLGHEGPLTMGELSRLAHITGKTITGVVDRLERDSYVERARDDLDRRVVRVRLTPKGKKTYQQFYEALLERLTAMMTLLEPDDRAHLLRIATVLHDRVVASPSTQTSKSSRHKDACE